MTLLVASCGKNNNSSGTNSTDQNAVVEHHSLHQLHEMEREFSRHGLRIVVTPPAVQYDQQYYYEMHNNNFNWIQHQARLQEYYSLIALNYQYYPQVTRTQWQIKACMIQFSFIPNAQGVNCHSYDINVRYARDSYGRQYPIIPRTPYPVY